MSDAWNPTLYNRFATERTQPFHDLLDLIDPAGVADAADLGCGTGELTQMAARRFGLTSMVGIDNSDNMLGQSAPFADEVVRFERGDIGAVGGPPRFDLIIANASLQWIAEHPSVLRRWTDALRPAGQLAVQVPANAYMPSHTVADEVARSSRFIEAFGPAGPPPDPVAENVLEPEEYAVMLHELGFTRQHVRLQVYPHLLEHSRDVVSWVRGTTLTRFQSRLDAETFQDFVAEYERRLLAVIGDRSPYLFPFRRILMWGGLSR